MINLDQKVFFSQLISDSEAVEVQKSGEVPVPLFFLRLQSTITSTFFKHFKLL